MFLKNLTEKQKDLFIDLCIQASNSNKDFTYEEKETIYQYCDEMNISEPRIEAKLELTFVIDELVNISSSNELRALAIEIVALMISDSKYDEFEKKFVKVFLNKAGITDTEHNQIIELLTELTCIYEKLSAFIVN